MFLYYRDCDLSALFIFSWARFFQNLSFYTQIWVVFITKISSAKQKLILQKFEFELVSFINYSLLLYIESGQYYLLGKTFTGLVCTRSKRCLFDFSFLCNAYINVFRKFLKSCIWNYLMRRCKWWANTKNCTSKLLYFYTSKHQMSQFLYLVNFLIRSMVNSNKT